MPMVFGASCSLVPPPPSSSPPHHCCSTILVRVASRPQTIVCSSRDHLTSLTTDALTAIQNSGVIACLRAESGELALEAARSALSSGISVVGTVLSVLDARDAVKAGAKFMMSPATIKEILLHLQDTEVLYIPGVMTPTEVLGAYEAGARVVKVYPVSTLGGVNYISVLKRPFPHIPMVASQGIKVDSIETYIDKGASAVVLSDAIFDKEAMKQRNYDVIHELARDAVFRGCKAVKRRNKEGV